MWQAFASAFGQFATSYGTQKLNNDAYDANYDVQKANVDAQNLINTANASASNAIKVANNGFVAAQASLSDLTRSLGNKNKLDAGAAQQDAITTNIARLQDSALQGSLETQLRSAEQLGAVRAGAAAKGVGGTTARMLQNTLAATAARAEEQATQSTQYQTYDMLQQMMGLTKNTINSLDEGQTFAPVDFTISTPQEVIAPAHIEQPNPVKAGILGSASKWATAFASITNSSSSPDAH